MRFKLDAVEPPRQDGGAQGSSGLHLDRGMDPVLRAVERVSEMEGMSAARRCLENNLGVVNPSQGDHRSERRVLGLTSPLDIVHGTMISLGNDPLPQRVLRPPGQISAAPPGGNCCCSPCCWSAAQVCRLQFLWPYATSLTRQRPRVPSASCTWPHCCSWPGGFVSQLLPALSTYVGEDISWRATNRLRSDLTSHVLRLDMSFHNARTTG